MSAKVNVPPDCVVQKTKNPDVVKPERNPFTT